MRARLEVIAERAGVSIATASRVLNNQPNVAADTRDRVLEAVRELAPPLRQTLMIGLVLPDTKNQFFSEVAFEFDRECERRNASLMVASSDGRADRELFLIDRFISCGVDGLLFISSGTGQSERLLSAVQSDATPPLVAFDRGVAGRDRVAVDSRKGTEQAVDHLWTWGHRSIGYIRGLEGTETAAERFDSFQIAMSKHRLDVNPAWVFQGDFKVDTGRRCGDKLLATPEQERPTAILAANDLIAIGLMQRLTEADWVLPRDLSVIGFDDIPVASWVSPRLTTIEQPVKKLVRQAMNLLMRRINDPSDREPESIVVEPELRSRKSVAAPFAQRLRIVD